MSGSDHRIGSKKAGLSGLFRACVVALLLGFSAPALAEPILIDVLDAKPNFDQRTNEPIITIKMTSASAKLFAELTSKNIGRRLELRIDGKTVMAPVIREPVMGGSMQVSGGWTSRQAKDLADSIAAGKFKIEVELAND
jgi:preprotein translocase subunit SecD